MQRKKPQTARHMASILYLAIFLISLEFLRTYCKMMCLVFVLMTASLAMQKNTNCQSAQGRYLNTLWVSNSRSSRAHSFLKMISTSTFKQMDNHYANQVLLGNSLLYWWSVRGNCSVSHTPDVKGHIAPQKKKKKGWGDKVQGAGEK